MLGATKITLFEKISNMCKKISNMSQKILLDIHHHMHQHMIEDTQKDTEYTEDTQKDTEDTDDTQEILTIKVIKVDYDYIIKITR
jgi:hypothetical protein